MGERREGSGRPGSDGRGAPLSLGAALDVVRGVVPPLGTSEDVPIAAAVGRFAAGDVVASRAVPGFDRAVVEGYAVRAESTRAATAYGPAVLEIVGVAAPDAPFDGRVGVRQAVRVAAGAPLPERADAVVPLEFAEEARGLLHVTGPLPPGRNVGRAGDEFAAGAVAVAQGRALGPMDVAALAALGMARVRVAPAPRVGILVVGDEVVRPGTELGPFEVHDAATPLLAALVERWGGRPATTTLQPDEEPRIRRALLRMIAATGVDMVVVAGGPMRGARRAAVAAAGSVRLDGVAIRPGGDTALGVVDGKPVLLLPGEAAPCRAAFDLLAGPVLRRLAGVPPASPYVTLTLPLTARIPSEPGRTDCVRVARTAAGVEPIGAGHGGSLAAARRGEGHIVVPHEAPALEAGTAVEVHLDGG